MALVFWQLIEKYHFDQPEKTPAEAVKQPSKSEQFKVAAEELVISELGQPIEGVEPAMLMEVLPGLIPADFDRAEAEIGIYVHEREQVVHDLEGETMPHSAAGALTQAGYNAIMSNVTTRLDIRTKDITADDLIDKLKEPAVLPPHYGSQPVACTADAMMCPDGSFVGRTGPNCEFAECPSGDSLEVDSFVDCVAAGNPVMESYPRQCVHNGQRYVEVIDDPWSPFPIRYGEDVSQMEEYRSDCEMKGGLFNECGSACGPEAEMCMDVCSMICEAPGVGGETLPPALESGDLLEVN